MKNNGSVVWYFFKIFFESLVDFIYPCTCLICDNRLEGKEFVCVRCWSEIQGSLSGSVQADHSEFSHIRGDLFFDQIMTCFDYTSQVEVLVHQLKYRRGKQLGFLLGQKMGEIFTDFFQISECNIMVPVPLHRVRHRERGYNQSEILCRGLCSEVSVQVYSNLLVRRKNTLTQTKLSAQDRQYNVKDAFCVRGSEMIRGKRIALVDDVVTTGATINSCAKCLKDAGAKMVVGLALARPKVV